MKRDLGVAFMMQLLELMSKTRMIKAGDVAKMDNECLTKFIVNILSNREVAYFSITEFEHPLMNAKD